MYREMLREDIDIYCDVWPCDRECGKFHKRFLNTTKLRKQKTKSESLDKRASSKGNDRKAKSNGVFEEIMSKAARKDSQHYVQPPLPALPDEFAHMTLGSTKTVVRQVSSNVDTTTIFYDNPVWDDAKFRQELLDSDDERFSIGEAPCIMDDDDTVDGILRDTQNEFTSNPIRHYEQDETILTEQDDEHGTLDLSKTGTMNKNRSLEESLLTPSLRSPDAKYENSLNDL